MHVLNGGVAPDRGRLVVAGEEAARLFARARQSARAALRLPGTLALPEPDRRRERPRSFIRRSAASAGAAGPARLILDKLDEIFPGHGVGAVRSRAGPVDRAAADGRNRARLHRLGRRPARLVILDEPTSSLDAHTAGQLLAYVRRAVASGVSCVLISHILGEVLTTCDRIVVMRDGKVVAADVARKLSIATKLVARHGRRRARRAAGSGRGRERMRAARRRSACACAPSDRADGRELVAHEGEIIGLAGLAGHGQTDLLLAAFSPPPVAPRRRDGHRAGRAGRRRPAVGRHLSAMVDRPEHRRPLARTGCARARCISPRLEDDARQRLARADQDPHARRPTTTFSRSRAAISRRRCSRARSAPTRASC